MKKLTAIALTAALTLSLSACGGSGTKTESSGGSEAVSVSETAGSEAVASEAAESEAAESEAAESEAATSEAAESEAAVSEAAASSATEQPAEEPEREHIDITMVRVGNIQDPTKDRILLALQEKFNFTLNIISVSWDQFPSQMQMMVSQGDDIDLIMGSVDDVFYDWCKEGMIYSYEELFEMGDYPLCEAVVYSDLYKELADPNDGLHYGKAMATPTKAWGTVIRTDWLEELGLEMPKTIEEFHDVIKAFAEADLGQVDCTGLDMRIGGNQKDISTAGIFGYIERAFNVDPEDFNFVENEDGTLSLWNTSDNAKAAAAFIRQLLEEGLINSDFMLLQQESDQGRMADDFASGKIGVAWLSNAAIFYEKLKAADPDASYAYLPPVTSAYNDVPNSGGGVGYWYVHAIPKTCENPARVMEILEWALTAEGREFTTYGIEGVHWTDKVVNEDGSRIYTINKEECAKDWDVSANGLRYPLCWGFLNYHAEIPYIPIEEYDYNYDEAYANFQSWLRDDEVVEGAISDLPQQIGQYSINSPLYGCKDPRMVPEDYAATMSVYTEYWLKAVCAESDEAFEEAWDEMCARTMEAGGDKILAGGNEVWAERQAEEK